MKHGRKLFLLALTGVMLLSLSISALAVDAYSDMTGSEWYAEAANQLREQGIMTGVGGNRFDANGTFTRAQLSLPSAMWRVSSGLMRVGLAVSRVAGEPLYASSTSESAVIAYLVRRGR